MSTSPIASARSAGWFYMLNFAFAPGMIAARRFIHIDDAATTAANILAHTTLFHAGFAGNLIAVAGYLVVTALFYQLFKPVDKNVSLIAALMSATGCAVLAVGCAFYLAPITILTGLHSTTGPALAQMQTLSLTLFRMYGFCYNTSLVFFSMYCLLIGNLTFRSTFIPRIFGVGMILAGSGWLIFLWPPLAHVLFQYVLLFGIGELALPLWLILKGVNADRWREQARTSSSA
jgi:hypothetical protein